jgi:hypothetical protein
MTAIEGLYQFAGLRKIPRLASSVSFSTASRRYRSVEGHYLPLPSTTEPSGRYGSRSERAFSHPGHALTGYQAQIFTTSRLFERQAFNGLVPRASSLPPIRIPTTA